ncbi:MAG: adenosylcobalamin-dependent ribonucleoside-diphosphate reductase [Alphaproteobacteria bacterium]
MEQIGADISWRVWKAKYCYLEEGTFADTWRRVAHTLAAVETVDQAGWEQRFYGILEDFKFLPGGRVQAGAGTKRNVTLFNCFVMGAIEDSIPGIFSALKEAALTMQQGGGIGCDFSTLRPRGAQARAVGTIASGPVSFMHVWDAMCGTILSTGARRGAMMATLRCDHPDIEEFITAKQQPGTLRRFNLSVQVTDEFMTSVRENADWPLIFPAATIDGQGETVMRDWPGYKEKVACRVVSRVPARALWDSILRATYDYAEPGVLFIDRINRLNNLWYVEEITATNPCGEIPLPPYGACDLGSINLTRFVSKPFSPRAKLEMRGIEETVRVAVRLLDNVIDVSRFPLSQQAERAHGTRRIGLGITGLADALLMLGHQYGSEQSLELAAEVIGLIRHTAYLASISIAEEKGSFPDLDRYAYLEGPFIGELPENIRRGIVEKGIRNSHLIALAPTGTISLLAGTVSSGLEPIFAASYERKVLDENGEPQELSLTDYAVQLWRQMTTNPEGVPPGLVTVDDLPVRAHLDMQAALQPFVDNSISKTINVPDDCPFSEFRRMYDLAYEMGLKGCTTFRPNPVTGAVLSGAEESIEAPHCCSLEREAD